MKYTLKKGGKYVGQGSFGCGFAKPPLKCKNETKRRNNTYITKVFRNGRNADEEINEGVLWMNIDPEQKFSIYSEKKCYLDTDNVKSENEFDKCTLPFSKNSEKTMIVSKFGGQDLFELKPVAANYSKLFKSFVPLFKGLLKVHKSKVTHNDIKEENIVATINDDSIDLRFIDFGYSYATKDMIEMNDIFLNTNYYYYWPFEFGCFDNQGNLYSPEKVKKRYHELVKMYKSDQRGFPINDVIAPKVDIDALYQHYKTIDFKDFDNTFQKLDIYSLGITLVKILYYYFKVFIKEGNNDFIYIVNLIDGNLVLHEEFLQNINNKYQKEWNTNVYTNIINPFVFLITQMVSISPSDRPSLEKIIESIEKIHPYIDEYLTTEKVRKGLYGFNILNNNPDDIVPPLPTPKPISPRRQFPPTTRLKIRNIKDTISKKK